jgi:Icc-related predicted phosphoesterase
MRLVIASDTHSLHRKISVPDGDVFIHCGDFSRKGTVANVRTFGKWLAELPHQHKIVVAGNHDKALENEPDKAIPKLGKVHYLEDTSLNIDGFTFYGSPWLPIWLSRNFQLEEDERADKWDHIPEDVDILITHGPPELTLDRNIWKQVCGDRLLRQRLTEISPAIHAFGHIHESSGSLRRGNTLYVNAAILNDLYKVTNPCRVVDLTRLGDGTIKARVVKPTPV